MYRYLITYDLRNPRRNYDPVYDYLKSHNWCKPLESIWVIESYKPIDAVINELMSRIDGDDGIYVVDITNKAARWSGIPQDAHNWLLS